MQQRMPAPITRFKQNFVTGSGLVLEVLIQFQLVLQSLIVSCLGQSQKKPDIHFSSLFKVSQYSCERSNAGVNEFVLHTFMLLPKSRAVIMSTNLAVFTAALFLLALVQCCFAANGKSPSEDPVSAYLTVMIAK